MEADKTQKLIDLIVAMDKKLDVHIATDEQTHRQSTESSRALHGSNGNVGLIAKVGRNTGDIGDIKRVGWVIMTPFLFAIGSGMVYLISIAK